jgi:hypothetical protein
MEIRHSWSAHVLTSQIPSEPSFSQALIALDYRYREVQSLRHLLAAQTTEVPQFDHLGFAFVDTGEMIQRIIDFDDVRGVDCTVEVRPNVELTGDLE